MQNFSNLNRSATPKEKAIAAATNPSGFSAIASGNLGDFRAIRDLHLDAISKGEMTPHSARLSLAKHAARLRAEVTSKASEYTTIPPHISALIGRAVSAKATRKAQADPVREGNELMLQLIIEQRLTNRSSEYEKDFARFDTGGDPRTGQPTIRGALAFHEAAKRSNDPALLEWSRRSLTTLGKTAADAQAREAIGQALYDPRTVDPSRVERTIEGLLKITPEQRTAVAKEALEKSDPSALVALVVVSQKLYDPVATEPWMSDVWRSMEAFPESAVNALETDERDRRQSEARAALLHAEVVATQAESWALLEGVQTPTEQEIQAGRNPVRPGKDFTAA